MIAPSLLDRFQRYRGLSMRSNAPAGDEPVLVEELRATVADQMKLIKSLNEQWQQSKKECEEWRADAYRPFEKTAKVKAIERRRKQGLPDHVDEDEDDDGDDDGGGDDAGDDGSSHVLQPWDRDVDDLLNVPANSPGTKSSSTNASQRQARDTKGQEAAGSSTTHQSFGSAASRHHQRQLAERWAHEWANRDAGIDPTLAAQQTTSQSPNKRQIQWSDEFDLGPKRPLPKAERSTVMKATAVPSSNLNSSTFESKVKMKLLPAIILLSKHQVGRVTLTQGLLREVQRHVREAHYLARERNQDPAVKPLMGLCCYYLGVCLLVKSTLDGSDHRPDKYFANAARYAKDVYPETRDAERLLRRYRAAFARGSSIDSPSSLVSTVLSVVSSSLSFPFRGKLVEAEGSAREEASQIPDWGKDRPGPPHSKISESKVSPTADARPDTADSKLANSLWNEVRQHKRLWYGGEGGDGDMKPAPLEQLVATYRKNKMRDSYVPTVDRTDSDTFERAESPRAPILRVINGTADSASASTAETQSNSPNSQASSDRPRAMTRDSDNDRYPSPKSMSHGKRKSVAFAAYERLTDSLSALSPTKGESDEGKDHASPQISPTAGSIEVALGSAAKRAVRRVSQAMALSTGRQTPDALRDAEEGGSPFRTTFGPIDEGGMKQRKKSAEEMV